MMRPEGTWKGVIIYCEQDRKKEDEKAHQPYVAQSELVQREQRPAPTAPDGTFKRWFEDWRENALQDPVRPERADVDTDPGGAAAAGRGSVDATPPTPVVEFGRTSDAMSGRRAVVKMASFEEG